MWQLAALSRTASEDHDAFFSALRGDDVSKTSSVGAAWKLASPHLVTRAAACYSLRLAGVKGGRFERLAEVIAVVVDAMAS